MILTVRIYVPVAKHAEFFALFQPAFDKVMAEPECRFFFVAKPKPDTPDYDPECITWMEGWTKDVDWLMSVQIKKDYYEPYMTETAKMFSKPQVFHFWTPENGMCQVKLPLSS